MNEGQGDHIQPKSKGGNGASVKDQSNIDIKSASFNNKKVIIRVINDYCKNRF